MTLKGITDDWDSLYNLILCGLSWCILLDGRGVLSSHGPSTWDSCPVRSARACPVAAVALWLPSYPVRTVGTVGTVGSVGTVGTVRNVGAVRTVGTVGTVGTTGHALLGRVRPSPVAFAPEL